MKKKLEKKMFAPNHVYQCLPKGAHLLYLYDIELEVPLHCLVNCCGSLTQQLLKMNVFMSHSICRGGILFLAFSAWMTPFYTSIPS